MSAPILGKTIFGGVILSHPQIHGSSIQEMVSIEVVLHKV